MGFKKKPFSNTRISVSLFNCNGMLDGLETKHDLIRHLHLKWYDFFSIFFHSFFLLYGCVSPSCFLWCSNTVCLPLQFSSRDCEWKKMPESVHTTKELLVRSLCNTFPSLSTLWHSVSPLFLCAKSFKASIINVKWMIQFSFRCTIFYLCIMFNYAENCNINEMVFMEMARRCTYFRLIHSSVAMHTQPKKKFANFLFFFHRTLLTLCWIAFHQTTMCVYGFAM